MFLLTVATIWAVAAVTPGPNFFIVARCAIAGSRRVALGAVAGTIVGTLVWGIAGWLGISMLFAAAPVAYVALKIVGGLYLIWLGLRLLLSARRAAPATTHGPDRRLTLAAAWRLGLVTNLANPKTVAFVAGLFAATLPPEAPWTYGAAAVLVMVTISALWYASLALLLNRPLVANAYRRARRVIDALAGIIFIGFGARLALSAK